MNEKQFLRELERSLAPLPKDQREEILNDYRAHFFEGQERGKSEEDLAKALGEPKRLARTFIADYHLQEIQNPRAGQALSTRAYHFLRASVVLISIFAFNFFFMLWPVLAIAFMLFIGFSLAAAAIVAGGAALLFSMWEAFSLTLSLAAHLTLIFYSISLFTGALLFGLSLVSLSRLFMIGLLRYIKLNAKAL